MVLFIFDMISIRMKSYVLLLICSLAVMLSVTELSAQPITHSDSLECSQELVGLEQKELTFSAWFELVAEEKLTPSWINMVALIFSVILLVMSLLMGIFFMDSEDISLFTLAFIVILSWAAGHAMLWACMFLSGGVYVEVDTAGYAMLFSHMSMSKVKNRKIECL